MDAIQKIRVTLFCNERGKFEEHFKWLIKDSVNFAPILFRGLIGNPSVIVEPLALDFGLVSYGFDCFREFRITNNSNVPLHFKLTLDELEVYMICPIHGPMKRIKVPYDCDQHGPERYFVVNPALPTVPAKVGIWSFIDYDERVKDTFKIAAHYNGEILYCSDLHTSVSRLETCTITREVTLQWSPLHSMFLASSCVRNTTLPPCLGESASLLKPLSFEWKSQDTNTIVVKFTPLDDKEYEGFISVYLEDIDEVIFKVTFVAQCQCPKVLNDPHCSAIHTFQLSTDNSEMHEKLLWVICFIECCAGLDSIFYKNEWPLIFPLFYCDLLIEDCAYNSTAH